MLSSGDAGVGSAGASGLAQVGGTSGNAGAAELPEGCAVANSDGWSCQAGFKIQCDAAGKITKWELCLSGECSGSSCKPSDGCPPEESDDCCYAPSYQTTEDAWGPCWVESQDGVNYTIADAWISYEVYVGGAYWQTYYHGPAGWPNSCDKPALNVITEEGFLGYTIEVPPPYYATLVTSRNSLGRPCIDSAPSDPRNSCVDSSGAGLGDSTIAIWTDEPSSPPFAFRVDFDRQYCSRLPIVLR